MAIADRVALWEKLQARGAFLLPVIRSLELAWLAVVLTATLFWANAPQGFLTHLAHKVWGSHVPVAALFGPVLAAAALVLGFASGPYVDASRVFRREAQQFAEASRTFLGTVVVPNRPLPSSDRAVWADMRAVCYKSHDYMKEYPFDPEDDGKLKANARALTHYWDKRAGSTHITADDVSVLVRYERIRGRAVELAVLLALALADVASFVVVTWKCGVISWLLLVCGIALLALEWRAKRVFLPFRLV